jgi:hypothetical protein
MISRFCIIKHQSPWRLPQQEHEMKSGINQKQKRDTRWRVAIFFLLSLYLSACAAAPSPDPAGPRTNLPAYPVLLTEEEGRRAAALAAWTALTKGQGIANAPAPQLQPVTATLRSLPTLPGQPLYLPKVGEGTTMSEEETRESLKRFILAERVLLGAEPQQLSLVQRTDAADGSKKARYEQRPFRFPLRNGYGVLEISFTPDRRILQITSTCIPEAETLREALRRSGTGATRPSQRAAEIAKKIVGRTLTYTDAAGNQQTYTVAAGDEIIVRELVIYPRPSKETAGGLEFHLAWEINLGGAPARLFYIDAITEEFLAAA